MSLVELEEPPRDRSIYVMNRTAIDSFGCVGSLFDGYRDEVTDTMIVSHYKKSEEFCDISRCKIVCGNKEKNQNILRMSEIDDATRLSVLLNLRENAGIGKIIDYDIPIKVNSRLFWYTHIKRTNQLFEDPEVIPYTGKHITSNIKGTHIITSVEWGIDVAIVLQLPNDINTLKEIDRVLEKIRIFLLNNQSISSLEQNEKAILKQIINTKVYSNINQLNYIVTLFDVCIYIQKNKYNIIDQPISYKLRPITWMYPQCIDESNRFIPLPERLLNSVEQYILKINADMKKLTILADRELPRRLIGKLPKVLSTVQKMCSNVKYQCANEIERFTRLLLQARKGEIELSKIRTALKDNQSIMIKTKIRNLGQIIHDVDKKALFINELNQQNFRYINISDYGIKKAHNEKIIESKLVKNDQYDRILCSNDVLNNNDHDQFCKLRDNLIKERENNLNLQLIYADFSYSSYKLKNMIILPRSVFNIDNNKLNQKQTSFLPVAQNTNTLFSRQSPTSATSSFEEKSTFIQTTIGTPITDLSTIGIQTYNNPLLTKIDIYSETPGEIGLVPVKVKNYTSVQTKIETPIPSSVEMPVKSEPSLISALKKPTITSPPKAKDLLQLPSILNSENKVINILLIGETGVGKSTFINALANYLTFDTLEEAENDQLVVLIPGLFPVNSGDNIEERIVKFGDIEDKHFEHPGRSITERCRSYEFNLKINNDQKLCIIDTPGFGDARGLLQDDHHMQHIMKYIKQFSSLNAICFLLNANEIRVNIFLRSCLTQLFSFLGPDIRSRIIFCFTSSRPTFYVPGKTVPLLKKMLSSFALAHIPFTKANTFCYDNESFRYLAGLQNGVVFTDLEKKDYEMSWSKSVAEAKRFIQYICRKSIAQ